MNGFCECGCGLQTKISNHTDKRKGSIKGEPRRFIKGHNGRGFRGRKWNGGKTTNNRGYILIQQPNHPRATPKGYVPEHILIVEKAMGKLLSSKHKVHHFDENTANNANINLIVCEDQKYHFLLHRRKRALEACGHANYQKCDYCGQWDDPKKFEMNKAGNNARHPECRRRYVREQRQLKKEELCLNICL